MSTELARLYELQTTDTRLQELNSEREALDSGAELRAEMETLRAEVQTARDQLRALEGELRDTELQIKASEDKKKGFEDKMYSGRVRNPKELEDMRLEVEMLARQVDALEDKGLEIMEEAEKRRASLAEQERDLRQLEGRLGETEQRYAAETARIADEVAALDAQRQQLVPAIPAELVRRYDEIRARRANLGIVKVTSDVCPGCRIAIPFDTMRQLKRGGSLLLCESCGRILYWQEPQPPPQQ